MNYNLWLFQNPAKMPDHNLSFPMETAMTSQISRIYHINIFTCQMFFKYRLIFVSYFLDI